jgi:AraC-like DNA-binding protein
MNDFFKYLTASQEDIKWGLYLNVAGKAEIPKNREYPLREHGHPDSYLFKSGQGRVLHEYQINYVTEGMGILENESGKYDIVPGTIMITFPGVWHRYSPLMETGWTENYIGFQGELAGRVLTTPWFSMDKPVILCDIREELIDTYYKIFDLVQKERPGFQYVASGMVMKLLGYIVSIQKQRDFKGKPVESIIKDVCFMLRQNVEKNIDFKEVADTYHIGYSYFRKMFKKYTGIAPGQYLLQLKIMRAKELLTNSNMSIKEISYELGFHSIYYFSRLYKEKTGMKPSDLRKT